MAKQQALRVSSGVPIPAPKFGRNAKLREQLRAMTVGESVHMTGIRYSTVWQRGMSAFGAGNFVVRKEGDGYRLWRTAGTEGVR